jgi:mono/diheme cytochrome c family protein
MRQGSDNTTRTAALVVTLGLGAAIAIGALAQDAPLRTVRDGVFSAAQVAAGREVFESVCVNCHEIEEFTGVGAYLEEVEGKPLWETFEYVWAEMPEDDPASLEPTDYAAVLSYIFSVYGLPTGDTDLPIERGLLENITITAPALAGG